MKRRNPYRDPVIGDVFVGSGHRYEVVQVTRSLTRFRHIWPDAVVTYAATPREDFAAAVAGTTLEIPNVA